MFTLNNIKKALNEGNFKSSEVELVIILKIKLTKKLTS